MGGKVGTDTGIAQKCFEAAGAFIVKSLVLGGEAAVGELVVEDAGGYYEFAFVTRGEGLR